MRWSTKPLRRDGSQASITATLASVVTTASSRAAARRKPSWLLVTPHHTPPLTGAGDDGACDYRLFVDVQPTAARVYDVHLADPLVQGGRAGCALFTDFAVRARMTGATLGGASEHPGHI